jgi:hypothetical protein
MGNDLIAWVVGLALVIVVVWLGLRRNLSDVTQSWLPRFGEGPKLAPAIPESSNGGRARRQLSPLQRRLAIWIYLLASVIYTTQAVLSSDSRLLHVMTAVLFAIGAVVFTLRRPAPSSSGSEEHGPSKEE